jgi:hypothetical protein
VDIIKSKPETERFLIVTFKPKNKGRFTIDIPKILAADLKEALGENIMERVSITTWGRETGSNQWRDYENTIQLGVLQRDDKDLVAAMLGQQFSLGGDVDSQQLAQLRISESAHLSFQALHRTRLRKGLPIEAWIVYQHPQNLYNELLKVMPGLPQDPAIKQRVTAVYRDIAKLIAEALDGLPKEDMIVSSKVLKRCPTLVHIPRNTFQRSRPFVSEFTSEWIEKEDGRSYVRNPFK